MKKIAIGMGAAGVLLLFAGIILKSGSYTAVSIIGGADGPTSIFIAGKINTDGAAVLLAAAAVGLILLGVWMRRKGEKK